MIPAWLTGAGGKALGALATVGLAALAVVTFGASQKRAGRTEQKAEATQATLDAVEKANETDRRVDAAGTDDLDRLRRRWTRP